MRADCQPGRREGADHRTRRPRVRSPLYRRRRRNYCEPIAKTPETLDCEIANHGSAELSSADSSSEFLEQWIVIEIGSLQASSHHAFEVC